MIQYDIDYKNLLKRVMDEGVDVIDRTGTGCRKVFDARISGVILHALFVEELIKNNIKKAMENVND